MPLIKKTSITTAPAAASAAAVTSKVAAPVAAAPANGTAAAVSRLKKKADAPAAGKPSSDYQASVARADETARGKTRCVQFEAALMSPALAGMKWDGIDEFLALCGKAADYGTAYSFNELPESK